MAEGERDKSGPQVTDDVPYIHACASSAMRLFTQTVG